MLALKFFDHRFQGKISFNQTYKIHYQIQESEKEYPFASAYVSINFYPNLGWCFFFPINFLEK